jgi:hypothetical protein
MLTKRLLEITRPNRQGQCDTLRFHFASVHACLEVYCFLSRPRYVSEAVIDIAFDQVGFVCSDILHLIVLRTCDSTGARNSR